jgi:phosphoglycolate phosphatase-like HAD superfamily hydrolase/ADP-ribose pyrophosphatase YjhB (NUDIX family)
VIRNIVFDWSGTLVDDLPAVWQATNHVFQLAGRAQISLETFRAEFCLPFKHFYDRFIPHVPSAQLEKWFRSRFSEVQHSIVGLKHSRDFLETCKARGIRSFVLTSVFGEAFEEQARVTGFAGYFERAYFGVMDKREKILEILREGNLDPTKTLFIGDMQHDIETARHGGLHSCAVLTGYNSVEQLRAAGPDLIVENLGELAELLERNNWELPSKNKAANTSMPIVTVGAVIGDGRGEVLMIRTHKWSNLWGIPGGKVKFGETSEEALTRELKEETNLDISDIRFVLVQDCIHSTEFYRDAHFVLLNYTCKSNSREVRLNDEAEEFRWLSPDAALALPLNKPTRVLLEALFPKTT